MNKNELIYGITEDTVQTLADMSFGRELTRQELEDTKERIIEMTFEIDSLVHQCVEEAIKLNALVRRNRNSKKNRTYYIVYHRNPNTRGRDYELNFIARSEADARKYIQLTMSLDLYAEWKITSMINRTETDVEVIHSPLF